MSSKTESRAAARRRAREANRMDRKERAKKIAQLRAALSTSRKEHGRRRQLGRAACIMGKIALRDLQKAERARLREAQRDARASLREALRAERKQARTNCLLALAQARTLAGVERRRAELAAKRAEHKETSRIARVWKGTKRVQATAKERTEESDDAVRANIPAELVPVFNRVKGTIKGSARISRTEAFLHFIHDNPDEAIAIQTEAAERDTDRLWAQLEKERAEARDARRRRPRAQASAPF